MPPRRRSIRPKPAPKRSLAGFERKAVRRLLSMQTTVAFKAQLEQEYVTGNLNSAVLSRAFRLINMASIPMQKKRAMLKALTAYNQLF